MVGPPTMVKNLSNSVFIPELYISYVYIATPNIYYSYVWAFVLKVRMVFSTYLLTETL